jgi:peroxiredoxin
MSFTLETGAKAPDFDLPGSNGRDVRFADVRGTNGTLIFFTCNHCPYVVGSEARMKALFERCQSLGITMTAIHSNETKDHPEDDFPSVISRARDMDFKWLSLRDDRQLIARAYGAERTPHYFLFDKNDELVYSGRMDNSPRDASKAETDELEDAIADMRAGRPAKLPRTDAIGCNIKWWDKEKHWMPKDACDLDYLYQRESTSRA